MCVHPVVTCVLPRLHFSLSKCFSSTSCLYFRRPTYVQHIRKRKSSTHPIPHASSTHARTFVEAAYAEEFRAIQSKWKRPARVVPCPTLILLAGHGVGSNFISATSCELATWHSVCSCKTHFSKGNLLIVTP